MSINLEKLYAIVAKEIQSAQREHRANVSIPITAAVALLEMAEFYITENKKCFVDPADVIELKDRPYITGEDND